MPGWLTANGRARRTLTDAERLIAKKVAEINEPCQTLDKMLEAKLKFSQSNEPMTAQEMMLMWRADCEPILTQWIEETPGLLWAWWLNEFDHRFVDTVRSQAWRVVYSEAGLFAIDVERFDEIPLTHVPWWEGFKQKMIRENTNGGMSGGSSSEIQG